MSLKIEKGIILKTTLENYYRLTGLSFCLMIKDLQLK